LGPHRNASTGTGANVSLWAPRDMDQGRRELLKLVGKAAVAMIGCAMVSQSAGAATAPISAASTVFDVRSFGAVGDGKAIDSTAINRAIEAASATGGAVFFPAGLYACYSLRLKSAVSLYLDQGSVIMAAELRARGQRQAMIPQSRMRLGRRSRTSDTITGTTA
jgi:polygalacturonase